jgi:hypothetical protein
LPVRRTLEKVGIPRATFYRWYDLYQAGGPEAMDDRHPKPDRVWNRIPDDVRERIIKLALEESALSPRELAVRFTDTEGYFVSEASVYRLLKAHDLIASPAFIVMKAADEFKDKTTAPNQLWQTDFTYLKVVGWGWFYLSTVLDDFSRYIIAWKLCTTMKAEDVTATLEMALEAAALDKARVLHRPRLLSDNGSSYISGDLAKWLKRHEPVRVMGAEGYPYGFNVTTEDGKSLKVLVKSPNGRTVIRPTSPGKDPVVMLPHSRRQRAEAGSVRIASVSVDPCDRGKRLVTVRVDLGDRHESMTMSVVVPNEGDESTVREFGIARAKDFARRFAELAGPV